MFALEPSAPLLTRVQNKFRLDFESLRGEKLHKERAWEQGRQCWCCWTSWAVPTSSQQAPFPSG